MIMKNVLQQIILVRRKIVYWVPQSFVVGVTFFGNNLFLSLLNINPTYEKSLSDSTEVEGILIKLVYYYKNS